MSELGQTPDIYHLTRVRDFENSQDVHLLTNVITLCQSCHRNVKKGNATLSV
ncbi:hypothetical protein [Haladaptatus caseinilyticus]|uniref:hypothetical protein n=1 Tax=Haladaptatus caseinilyticus TaxID=2993314 RepID=UPI003898D776